MDDKYKALYLKLAELLGWTNVTEDNRFSSYFGVPPEAIRKVWGMSDTQRTSMPNWLIWTHCGPLMVEHCVVPSYLPYYKVGIVGYPNIKVFGGNDMDMAVREAICLAVVEKLEREKNAG